MVIVEMGVFFDFGGIFERTRNFSLEIREIFDKERGNERGHLLK